MEMKKNPRNQNDRTENQNNNKTPHRPVLVLLFAAVLVVAVYSGYRVLAQLATERAGKSAYASVDAYLYVGEEGGQDTEARTGTEDSGSAEEIGTESEKTTDTFPTVTIDYNALQEINPDFAAVLYVPALDLLYPAAYSSDNTEYLTRTFAGTQNPCGSIFVDCNASRDFTDLHTLIFGHNMKNGTMFGSLKKFYQNPDLVKENPYFYLYTQKDVLCYRIFADLTLPVDDPIYTSAIDSEEDYDALVQRLQSASSYAPEEGAVDFTTHPDLVALSTCYGTGHTDNFVTCGVLVGEKAADTGKEEGENPGENKQSK